jgi:phage terminase large subunit-like protein
MRIEIPPLKLTPPITRGYVSDIVANQQLRQQELEAWQLSITSKYQVAEGCRPANIFDALIGRIDDPALVLMNKARTVKLVRVEGIKQLKAEGWVVVACEFNKRNKKNIDEYLSDAVPVSPTREEALKEYEAMKAKYHNNLVYNPVRFIWR